MAPCSMDRPVKCRGVRVYRPQWGKWSMPHNFIYPLLFPKVHVHTRGTSPLQYTVYTMRVRKCLYVAPIETNENKTDRLICLAWYPVYHRRIWLIEGNVKSPPKSNLQKDFGAAVYPLLGFCAGIGEQFCSFWIWSYTECKSPAEYGLQHDSNLSPHATDCLCFPIKFSFSCMVVPLVSLCSTCQREKV